MKTTRLGQEAQEPTTNLETVKMSIDESSIDVLMSNLTNLYSDPVIAVLREYSSNAVDSHNRAGVTEPILITTPKSYSEPLVIQDFGVGMSKDEIANVYSRYGLSTKTDSNLEIGGFGLGCKSALAIADRFDIVSVKDGIKTTAFIQKNIKGVGVVHFVSEEATNDRNGVKVSIPMGNKSGGRFHRNDMVKFFSGMPSGMVSIDGDVIPTSYDEEWNQLEIGGVRVGAYYSKAGSYYNTLVLTVGGVNYGTEPLAVHEGLSKFKNKTNRYNIVIDLPIGSVDLTPSREALMLTDKTLASVSAALKNVEEAIIANIFSRINTASTLEEATKIYNEERMRGYWMRGFIYRGLEVPEDVPLAHSQRIYRSATEKRKLAYSNATNSISIFDGFGVEPRSNNNNVIFVQGDATQVEALSKSLYYYMMSIKNTGKVNAILFEKAELNNAIFAAMTKGKIIAADDVIANAEKYRSDSRKASLAATKAAKASGAAPTSKFPTMPTWDLSGDDLTVKPVATEILQQSKVAYIHGSESIPQLRRIFPTIGWHYENGGVKLYENNNSTLSLMKMALPNYKVVFLASTRSTAKFLEVVPNAVDAGSVLSAYADKMTREFADSIVAYSVLEPHGYGSRGTSRGTYFIANMSKLLSQYGLISKITNEEVRNALIEFAILESETKKFPKNMINSWIKPQQSSLDKAVEIVAKYDSIQSKLVLLQDAHLSSEEQAKHAVNYINMVMEN